MHAATQSDIPRRTLHRTHHRTDSGDAVPIAMSASTIRVVDTLQDVNPDQWNALAGSDPFLSHAMLAAFESSGCVGADSGWVPCHLLLERGGVLAAAMPLYLKSHSYGEYVFDWAWADAYHRHGLSYYPKLVSAVPFTPVTGSRLLAADDKVRRQLIDAALEFAARTQVSSLHCLFPPESEAQQLASAGLMLRRTVQFHWRNEAFADFDAFLARMNHDKRKKIRQERRRLRDQGIVFERISGTQATDADWQFFNECYRRTYRSHMSTPYLNAGFFSTLAAQMPERLLLVIARRDGRRIAAALDVLGPEALYGRYWGTAEYHSGLHFEVCYYQAIEHCIEHGIARFEGGAQGEHKLARGLMPIATVSAHWLAHPQFAEAVADFLKRERRGIEHYVDELGEHSPFKHTGDGKLPG